MPDSTNSVWEVRAPTTWPAAPRQMSYSVLTELESCPRRWALRTANYPSIWNQRGYPKAVNPAAIEGSVVHSALEDIARALVQSNCSALSGGSAVAVFKNLGGFSAIILNSTSKVLRSYENNPRASHRLDDIRRRLVERGPQLRSRIQTLLGRIQLSPTISDSTPSGSLADDSAGLRIGSHSEVHLLAQELGWHGIADLIVLRENGCELRDFKTGEQKPEHELQLHVYAYLWSQDKQANPTNRPVDRLVVSYDFGDVIIPSPSHEKLVEVGEQLRLRTQAALNELASSPPRANPSPENCEFCPVRQLCNEYWKWLTSTLQGSAEAAFADVEIMITARHGPTSWDGIVNVCSIIQSGDPVVLLVDREDMILNRGQCIRALNAHVGALNADSASDDRTPRVVTLGASSELYYVPQASVASAPDSSTSSA